MSFALHCEYRDVRHAVEVWSEVVDDALPGSGQGDAAYEEDEEHYIGEGRREVHDLQHVIAVHAAYSFKCTSIILSASYS